MTMDKKVRHTPGPLKIWGRQEKTEISGFYMIGSDESEITMGCAAYVCSEHDAKLYCAAPQLLEALEELYMSVYGGNSVSIEDAMNRAPKTDVFEQKIIAALKLAKDGES